MDARETRRLIRAFQERGLGNAISVVSLTLELPGHGDIDLVKRAFEASGSPLSFENFDRFVDNCLDEAGQVALLHLGNRVRMAQNVVNTPGVDGRQVDAVVASLVASAGAWVRPVLETYQRKLEAAHAACTQLLDVPTAHPQTQAGANFDEDLCVCCLDSPRSVVYRPCSHRVCCAECAAALWAKSRTCPWCRAGVEDPGC